MDAIIGGTARFFGFLCSYTLCQCYNGALIAQNAMITRMWHLIIFVLYVVSGWFLHNHGPELIQYFPILNNLCPEDTCSILLIDRLSFALFTFYIILALILYGAYTPQDPRAQFQNQCWQLKFPLLIVLIIGAAFIPEGFFLIYGWVALVGACLFVLVQLFLLVEFAHTFAEWSNEGNGNESNEYHHKIWLPFLVASSSIMFISSIALIVYMIFLFEEFPSCRLNYSIAALNLFIIIIVLFGSFYSKFREKNKNLGLFQASAVILFATYFTWNAVIVDDPGQCTAPFAPHGSIYWITTIFGSFYTIGLVLFSSFTINHPQLGTPPQQDSYNYSKVNFFFALASMYLRMLLTNWAIIRRYNDGTEAETSVEWVSLVVDVLSLVLLAIVYFWTVSAPLCCPSRDFTHTRKPINDVT